MICSKIKYTGAYVPDRIVDNHELSNYVDTNDEWIKSRTGVGERHFTMEENTSDLAAGAAKDILKKGNIDPLSIELIIVATVSPDYTTPATACLVQAKIGAKNAVAFDVAAACSGFVFSLSIADKFIKSGVYKNALVIGAEVLSKLMDFNDRTTCVLFGDGSAGVFLERGENGGILSEDIGSDGERGMSLTAGKAMPSNIINGHEKNKDVFIQMDGKAVFDFATRQCPKCIHKLADDAKIDLDSIKYVIPHQANSRIIDVIARKVKIPVEKFYLNMYYYANTSSASIPIALNEMMEKGMLKEGDKIILIGFGGGLTWGSMLIEL